MRQKGSFWNWYKMIGLIKALKCCQNFYRPCPGDFFQMMTLGLPWQFLWQIQICSWFFCIGDSLQSIERSCISKFVLIQHILSTQMSDTGPTVFVSCLCLLLRFCLCIYKEIKLYQCFYWSFLILCINNIDILSMCMKKCHTTSSYTCSIYLYCKGGVSDKHCFLSFFFILSSVTSKWFGYIRSLDVRILLFIACFGFNWWQIWIHTSQKLSL